MINTLLGSFLAKAVNLKKDDLDQANKSQKTLREIINNKLEDDSSLPFLLEDEIFLFGSAVRGTKPAPLDDIDLMLVLDGSLLSANENGRNAGNAIGSAMNYNPVLNTEYLDENGFVSSQKILNRIREAVDETYSRSEIRKDGQAVNLWMESYGFGIDIVPAFKINHLQKGVHYFIPVGTNSHMWQSANPLVDLRLFGLEDGRLNGLLCSTAKLMRKWNELSNNNILSGFHIDALVYKSLYGTNINNLETTLIKCFNSFYNLLSSQCEQFTNYGPAIDCGLTNQQREQSKQNIIKAKAELTSTNLQPFLGVPSIQTNSRKISSWNKVFGQKLLENI